jgi:colanic acid biosynthesis glycosyl transferase WcaI
VLPSKLANMLASGRPVLATARPGTGLSTEVAGCGLVVSPENDVEFARAIEYLLDNEAARSAFARAARVRAEQRWAREAILNEFEIRLLALLNPELMSASNYSCAHIT